MKDMEWEVKKYYSEKIVPEIDTSNSIMDKINNKKISYKNRLVILTIVFMFVITTTFAASEIIKRIELKNSTGEEFWSIEILSDENPNVRKFNSSSNIILNKYYKGMEEGEVKALFVKENHNKYPFVILSKPISYYDHDLFIKKAKDIAPIIDNMINTYGYDFHSGKIKYDYVSPRGKWYEKKEDLSNKEIIGENLRVRDSILESYVHLSKNNRRVIIHLWPSAGKWVGYLEGTDIEKIDIADGVEGVLSTHKEKNYHDIRFTVGDKTYSVYPDFNNKDLFSKEELLKIAKDIVKFSKEEK